jgi:hypothetical protein
MNEDIMKKRFLSGRSVIWLVPVLFLLLLLGGKYNILGLGELPYALGYYLNKLIHYFL